jgi:hypothetical protein
VAEPQPQKIPVYLSPDQIEEAYERLLEEDPERERRFAARRLRRLLKDVHLQMPDVPEEEVERDIEEAIRAVRQQKRP